MKPVISLDKCVHLLWIISALKLVGSQQQSRNGSFTLDDLDLEVAVDNKSRGAVSFPLYGSVHSTAYWFADLYFGSEPQRQSLIVDTGSSVMAFPCSDCGEHCGTHIDNPFDATKSSSAKSIGCVPGCLLCARDINTPRDVSDARGQCAYHIRYTEGSSLMGKWYEDFVWLNYDSIDPMNSKTARIKVPFGCHTEETHLFVDQDASGILGLEADSRYGPEPFVTAVLADRLAPYTGISNGITTPARDLGFNNVPANAAIQPQFAICLSPTGGALTIGGPNRIYHVPEIKTKVNTADSMSFASIDSHRVHRGKLENARTGSHDFDGDSSVSDNPRGKYTDMNDQAFEDLLTNKVPIGQWTTHSNVPSVDLVQPESPLKQYNNGANNELYQMPSEELAAHYRLDFLPPDGSDSNSVTATPPFGHTTKNRPRKSSDSTVKTRVHTSKATKSGSRHARAKADTETDMFYEEVNHRRLSVRDDNESHKDTSVEEFAENIKSFGQYALQNKISWTPMVTNSESPMFDSYLIFIEDWRIKGINDTNKGEEMIIDLPILKPPPLGAPDKKTSLMGTSTGLLALVDSGTTLTYVPFLVYANFWTNLLKTIATGQRTLLSTRNRNLSEATDVTRVSGRSMTSMKRKLGQIISKLERKTRFLQQRRQRLTSYRRLAEDVYDDDTLSELSRILLRVQRVENDLVNAKKLYDDMNTLEHDLQQEAFAFQGSDIKNDLQGALPRDLQESQHANKIISYLTPDGDKISDSTDKSALPRRRLAPVTVPNLDEECWFLSEGEKDFRFFPDMKLKLANDVEYVWRPHSFLYRKGKAKVFCLTVISKDDAFEKDTPEMTQKDIEAQQNLHDFLVQQDRGTSETQQHSFAEVWDIYNRNNADEDFLEDKEIDFHHMESLSTADLKRKLQEDESSAVLGSSFFINHDLIFNLGNWTLGLTEAACPNISIANRKKKRIN